MVDGTPAESVLFGLQGLLRDRQPDLVISGVNGGENTGMEWLFSGTIGAARMATVLGVPAIAISGLSITNLQSLPIVMQWLVDLARSRIVQELKAGQYLTVSIPRVKAPEIKGIDVVSRAFLVMGVEATPFRNTDPNAKQESWEFQRYVYKGSARAGSDLASYNANRIAIVLMQADENDRPRIEEFQKRISEIPVWRGAPAQEKK